MQVISLEKKISLNNQVVYLNQSHSPKKTWILEMVMTGSNTFTNT